MAGHPCCCIGDGIWDMYWGALQPNILDMCSFYHRRPTYSLGTYSTIPGSTSSAIEDFYEIIDQPRSYVQESYHVRSRLKSNNPWYITQVTGMILPFNHRNNDMFFHKNVGYYNSALYNIYLGDNGMINLRANNEKVGNVSISFDKNSLITNDDIPSSGFKAYKSVFLQGNVGTPDIDSNIRIFEKWRNIPNDMRHLWSIITYEDKILNGYEFSYSPIELERFRLSGLVPYVHSFTYPDTSTTIYLYDVFGNSDNYPGSSASYSLQPDGSYRYSLNQPFFTGLHSHIQHALDLPNSTFQPSILGYKPEYENLDISGTGIYVCLYGYNDYNPPESYGNTIIIATGSYDYFYNMEDWRNNPFDGDKIIPPLVSKFILDEGLIDSNRNPGIDITKKAILELELHIKPEELRNFIISFNKSQELIGASILSIDSSYNNDSFILSFGNQGEVYYKLYKYSSDYLSSLVNNPFVLYERQDNGFYKINMFINSEDVRSFFPTIVNEITGYDQISQMGFPDMTGGYNWSSQSQSTYESLLSSYAASGYIPFDLQQERAIYIQPYKYTFGGSSGKLALYHGQSGDGFSISGDVKVKIYDTQMPNTLFIQTNVAQKNFQMATNDVIHNSINSSNKYIVDNFKPSGYLQGTYIETLPMAGNILSCDKNYITTVNKRLNNISLEVGSPIIGTRYWPIVDSINIPTIVQQYNVQTNTISIVSGYDIMNNVSNCVDKVSIMDEALAETIELYPALLSSIEPKNLVISCDNNCYPRFFDIGETIGDIKSHIDNKISYNYHLSDSFYTDTIQKVKRSGSITSISGLTGIGCNVSTTHTDSLEDIQFVIPQTGTKIGTTTIYRPSGNMTGDPGYAMHIRDFFDSKSGSLADKGCDVFGIVFDYSSPNLYKCNYYYSSQTEQNETSYPYTGNFYAMLPLPKFVDSFVYDYSPVNIGKTEISIFGTGSGSQPYTDLYYSNIPGPYGQVHYIGGGSGIYNPDNWNGTINSGINIPYHYSYSNYDDNYAFYHVETVDATGIQRRSFNVNGNYIFRNVTGLENVRFNFKVGPKYLAYVMEGLVVDNQYYPPYQLGDGTFFKKVGGTGSVIDPPELIDVPSYTIHLASLSGIDLWAFSGLYGDYHIPRVIGMTDEHIYMDNLPLATLPNPSRYIGNAFSTADIPDLWYISVKTDPYISVCPYWRISYSGHFCPMVDFINDEDDFFTETAFWLNYFHPLSYDISTSQSILDQILITHNSQISDTPKNNTYSPYNYINLASDLKHKYFDDSFTEQIDPTGVLSGWYPGPDVYLDVDKMKLTNWSGDYTGVFMYRNIPVPETGRSYVINLNLILDAFPDKEIFIQNKLPAIFEFRHSGVYGLDGHEVYLSTRLDSIADDYSHGLDDEYNTIFSDVNIGLQSKAMSLFYTVDHVTNPSYAPFVISMRTKDKTYLSIAATGQPDMFTLNGFSYWVQDTGINFNSWETVKNVYHPSISGVFYYP